MAQPIEDFVLGRRGAGPVRGLVLRPPGGLVPLGVGIGIAIAIESRGRVHDSRPVDLESFVAEARRGAFDTDTDSDTDPDGVPAEPGS